MIKLSSILNEILEENKNIHYFYHATLADRLPSIQKNGLQPSEETNWGGELGKWSFGKIFLASKFRSANYYGNILWRNNHPNRYRPILRIKYDINLLTPDQQSSGDFYSESEITVPIEIFVYNEDTKTRYDSNGDTWFNEKTGHWRELTKELSEGIYHGEWDGEIIDDDEINEVEKIDYPMMNKGGYSVRGEPDWKKFKLNGVYQDGDVLNYIHSQHDEFEDDDRVDGNFQLIAVDPNSIEDSEWSISDTKVQSLSQSDKQFPPIVIDDQGSIIDGGHRLAAAKLRRDKQILVFKPVKKSLTEDPDGFEFDGVTIDIWENSDQVEMVFILADIEGRNTYFGYIPERSKIITNNKTYQEILDNDPPSLDDYLTTHGNILGYIENLLGFTFYTNYPPIKSRRLIHGRVFNVRGQLIMSCWEKLSMIELHRRDLFALLKHARINPREILYEVGGHNGEFFTYDQIFKTGVDKEQTTSDEELRILQQLHLNPELKHKILKLPVNKLAVVADKLNMPVIQLKNLLGRNVAESSLQKEETVTERMSYNDLLRSSEDGRKNRAKTVRARSLPVSTENNKESWNFRYKSNPSRTGNPHQGNIKFFKESTTDNAADIDCQVDCSCPDFKYRFAYADAKQDASQIGNNSLNKCINRRPAVRNPREIPGMCKHLIALKDYLKTKIDNSSKQRISESLDALTKTPTFNVEYFD